MTLVLLLLIAAVVAPTASADQPPTIVFEPSQVHFDQEGKTVTYADFEASAVGQQLMMSVADFVVELWPNESIDEIRWEVTETASVGTFDVLKPLLDVPTGAAEAYAGLRQPGDGNRVFGSSVVTRVGQTSVDDRHMAELLVWPVTVDAQGHAVLNTAVTIFVGNRAISAAQLRARSEGLASQTPALSPIVGGPTPGAVEYVIVTSESLVAPLQVLADYKTSLGIPAEIALIDEILAQYDGIDDPERLREYLKVFHAQGGKYVLMAGDETVLPLRYAYNFSTSTQPEPDVLQICDLYYADLSGNWDADGDGVWGEPSADSADLDPEVRVGRLPFNTVEDLAAWVAKLIAYETNPGGDDREYLNSAFFFSSDQMRDYSQGGQHGRIAAAYPGQFVIDTVAGVEAARGDDVAPYNASAHEMVDFLGDGHGIVNILAHGATLLFEVRTSGYNHSPKSRFSTLPGDGLSGSVSDLLATGKTGFYYSLACDNGAFDKDQPPFDQPYTNLVQAFLAQPQAGAVAFVANTRWGWVGASHLLQKVFFDSLFAHPEAPAVDAMYASKKRYYYYRDLVYGQCFFGDPSMKIYHDLPGDLDPVIEPGDGRVVISVVSDDAPVGDCHVVLSDSSGIIAYGNTDGGGQVDLSTDLGMDDYFVVTAQQDGYSIGHEVHSPAIASDIVSDPDALPGAWKLGQNYPNPFNPTTTIPFTLPRASAAELTIINLLGQTVATLFDGRLSAGEHEADWNGLGDNGTPVASGLYFYNLVAGDFTDQKKMILLK